MQKIDISTFEELDEATYIYRIVELKHPKSTGNTSFASEQLRYYINWACEEIGGRLLGGTRFNIKPVLLSLARKFNSIPPSVANDVRQLSEMATEPEIWEADFSFNIQQMR